MSPSIPNTIRGTLASPPSRYPYRARLPMTLTTYWRVSAYGIRSTNVSKSSPGARDSQRVTASAPALYAAIASGICPWKRVTSLPRSRAASGMATNGLFSFVSSEGRSSSSATGRATSGMSCMRPTARAGENRVGVEPALLAHDRPEQPTRKALPSFGSPDVV